MRAAERPHGLAERFPLFPFFNAFTHRSDSFCLNATICSLAVAPPTTTTTTTHQEFFNAAQSGFWGFFVVLFSDPPLIAAYKR